MEIKNLFDLAKADKYTADGRDQIVDARKTYQVGEISQATGLQKTANGWVKPKNGAGAQKQEAGSKENKMDIGSTVKVKVNGGREGKITGIRGDVVTVEMPAQGDKPARRDQYYKSDLEAAGEQKRTDNTTGKDYKEGQTVPQAKAMQSTMQHREKQAMQVYSKLKQEGASSDQTYAAAQLVRSSRELGDLLGVIGKDPEDPLNEATAEKLNSMMQEHAKLQKEVDSIQEHREASEATVTNTMTDLKRKGKIEDYWSLGYANEDAAKNKLRSVYNINNDDDVEKVWTSIKKEYLKKNADRYDPEDLKNVMENAGIKPEDLNNEAKNPAEENKKKYGPVQRKYKDVDVHTKDIGQLPEEEQKKWYVMWDNVITNKFKDQYRTLQAKEKGVTKWDIPTPDVNFDKESGLITVWTDKGKEFYKTKISGIQRTEVDPKTGEAKKQDYDLYHRDADGNKDMEESISFEGAGTKDSAPLTGDTRVKLSQICDAARKTYQVGEISQATGLQKTATGWVKPKETKYGKVTQKEGTWGVQQKLGKGSKFIPHKNESDAKNALSNYTAGYNTTERSKEDPHSDKARQQKRWNEEVEGMKKEGRAGRRAEHASHFQNQQAPAGSPAAAITPELKEAVKKQKAEEARKRNVIEEWLDETGLKKKSPAGSTEMKPGQKVRFKTNRGETYTGKVVEVKENSIKFEDANGKPMTFRKDAIVESAPKTEEKWAAPGPVKIPSSEALMKHLV